MNKTFKFIAILTLSFFSSVTLAGIGLLDDVIRQVDRAVIDAGKEVNRAHEEIKSPAIEYQRLERESANSRVSAQTLRIIEEAQQKVRQREAEVSRSISEAESKLDDVNVKLGELKTLSDKIEAEKQALQSEKMEIERRE